jgi:hypothetical protein
MEMAGNVSAFAVDILRLLPPVDIAVEDPLDFNAFAGGFVENHPAVEGRRPNQTGHKVFQYSSEPVFQLNPIQ